YVIHLIRGAWGGSATAKRGGARRSARCGPRAWRGTTPLCRTSSTSSEPFGVAQLRQSGEAPDVRHGAGRGHSAGRPRFAVRHPPHPSRLGWLSYGKAGRRQTFGTARAAGIARDDPALPYVIH